EGFEVSAGVLNQLDSDAEAARALDISCALEQPFSAIGNEAFEEARLMVSEADGVVVSAVPFGSGNVVNLELAADALRAGKPVWMASGIAARDYTVDKAATLAAERLRNDGAVEWSGIHELMTRLERDIKNRQ
ncbi:MAG: ABC transporter ATP-binding protein, partial [Chlorobiales bacterium]|nr:ABC transporter ATP-binding protein [Chlorobiales bacterium]